MEDRSNDTNPYLGSMLHCMVMFFISLTFFLILVRVIIVAEPGYNFHAWFSEPEILTVFDSRLIRGLSFVAAVPLFFLTPAFFIAVENRKFARKLFAFLDPIMDALDRWT